MERQAILQGTLGACVVPVSRPSESNGDRTVFKCPTVQVLTLCHWSADQRRLCGFILRVLTRQVRHVLPALLLWCQEPLPFWLLLFNKLAGGWIEDLTESCPSTPSTDFTSELQPTGSVGTPSSSSTINLTFLQGTLRSCVAAVSRPSQSNGDRTVVTCPTVLV